MVIAPSSKVISLEEEDEAEEGHHARPVQPLSPPKPGSLWTVLGGIAPWTR